ncbi:hypothetical protein [Maribellus maritimus]|uniref:hypothetical protein n=1 Tax=Maribellus maritimus TaxID=2870838 RepID=UPI001EEC3E80|nr:hypothetical protein [Maribellus maritimus]MCG6187663.1 hypothetical protein [Maribellus maritimus]
MKQLIPLILIALFTELTCYSQGVKSLDPDIYGYWITNDCLQEIEKTRDPFITIKNNPYKILILNPEIQSGDTIKISFDEARRSEFSGFSFYKITTDSSLNYVGYSFWKPSDIEYNKSEAHKIRYDKTGDLLIVTTHSGMVTRYKRIPEFEKDKYMDNLTRLINQILLSDTYIFDNKIIAFTDDGKVLVFNDYKSFRIGIIYSFDFSLFQNNYIEFSESPIPGKYYSATENFDNRFSFEFDSDTLKLSEIKEETINGYRLVKGRLKYKLTKYTP